MASYNVHFAIEAVLRLNDSLVMLTKSVNAVTETNRYVPLCFDGEIPVSHGGF